MNPYTKFYKLSPQQRRDILAKTGAYDAALDTPLPEAVYENMIENSITTYELPFGVVPEFKLNSRNYCIPLAVEEPSVIAALNNANKKINTYGSLSAQVISRLMRGQIAFMNPGNPQKLVHYVSDQQPLLFELADQAYPSIVKRGGGIRELTPRILSDGGNTCVLIEALIDTQEAMGANMINTIMESLAQHLQIACGETVLMSILSNHADHCLTEATCTLDVSKIADGAMIAQRIEDASRFAEMDAYRAATHNKGIMNGLEAIAIATGNDWRALAASIHAYAGGGVSYQPLSTWRYDGQMLTGKLTVPLPIARVGGSIGIHPKAQLAHAMLKVENIQELMQVFAGVGLAQNFAALYALVTDGIQKGHMQLQARSLALQAGALPEEIDAVLSILSKGPMNLETAQAILQTLRKK